MPPKSKLDKVLTDYEKASEDSRAHLARAETDEQAALNNLELSDEESADRVAVAQRSISIYRARIANREAAQAKLFKELEIAVNEAHNAYRSYWPETTVAQPERQCVFGTGQTS